MNNLLHVKARTCLVLLCAIALVLTGCAGKNAADNAANNEQSSGQGSKTDETAETVNIAVLKGPTAIGMVNLMSQSDAGKTKQNYNFQIAGTADEITADLIKGNLQIAAIPANLASVLYNKTEGNIRCLAINNLGVLYIVETGDEIHSVADLAGKTIYSTGKGTTPEYTLNYLLSMAGINPEKDVTIEYKSEATEIAAIMAAASSEASEKNIIAMLPQPYVTVVTSQNEAAHIALDVTQEWDKLSEGKSTVVTGVIAVNAAFADEHPGAVETFLEEYKASANAANSDVEGTAALVEAYDIFKAAVAKKAIPMCNIVCLTGDDMKSSTEAYLEVLKGQNPASIGSEMPGDDFYYGAY